MSVECGRSSKSRARISSDDAADIGFAASTRTSLSRSSPAAGGGRDSVAGSWVVVPCSVVGWSCARPSSPRAAAARHTTAPARRSANVLFAIEPPYTVVRTSAGGVPADVARSGTGVSGVGGGGRRARFGATRGGDGGRGGEGLRRGGDRLRAREAWNGLACREL